MSSPPFIRLYPPGHCLGHPTLWLWQVCSMCDIEMSGTSDDMQDAMDTMSTAWASVNEADK